MFEEFIGLGVNIVRHISLQVKCNIRYLVGVIKKLSDLISHCYHIQIQINFTVKNNTLDFHDI